MSNNYVERLIYDAGGHTGSTYYFRITRRLDNKVWNPTSEELVAPADIAWADAVNELEEQGPPAELTGVFPIVIQHDWRTVEDIAIEDYGKPYVDLTAAQKVLAMATFEAISNIPASIYDIVVYKQLGSEPDNTDDVEKQFETKLGGSIFGF